MLSQSAFQTCVSTLPWQANMQARKQVHLIARLAVRSLYAELVLYPKPGLVSLRDQGSHSDMDAACFMRSLFALRHYFKAITIAGARGAGFEELRQLGIGAEQRMLLATGGVNTHRGAIFALGILCATAACCLQQGQGISPASLQLVIASHWGQALREHSAAQSSDDVLSHGQQVAHHYAVSGAREEAAAGFPSIFDVALPRMQKSLRKRSDIHLAQVDTFFALMAHISDTNLYHRGGTSGVDFARTAAQEFLNRGATENPVWLQLAEQYHQQFIQRKLSPGGAADLLAATCFVHDLCMNFPVAEKP